MRYSAIQIFEGGTFTRNYNMPDKHINYTLLNTPKLKAFFDTNRYVVVPYYMNDTYIVFKEDHPMFNVTCIKYKIMGLFVFPNLYYAVMENIHTILDSLANNFYNDNNTI